MNTITLTVEEAKIVRAALIAFEQSARSDETHFSHEEKFEEFKKKIREFITSQE